MSANRPRRRRGISQSGIRLIEAIVRRGERATRRAVSSWQRRQWGGGSNVLRCTGSASI